jgi:HEAT repeat protein
MGRSVCVFVLLAFILIGCKAQDRESVGLSANIVAPAEMQIINGRVKAQLVLTNNNSNPIRLTTLCQGWRSMGEDFFEEIFRPDIWKSDRPTDKKIKENITAVQPDESVFLPMNFRYTGWDTITLKAGYEIGEEFAREHGTWRGIVSAEPIVLNARLYADLPEVDADFDLSKINDSNWEKMLPDMEKQLKCLPSDKTNMIVEFLAGKMQLWKFEPYAIDLKMLKYTDSPQIQRSLVYYLLHSKKVNERRAAVGAAKLNDKATYEKVIKILNSDPSDIVRTDAVFCLARTRFPKVAPYLLNALKSDTSREVRAQAAYHLGCLQYKPAADALYKAVKSAGSGFSRLSIFAVEALGRVGDTRAVPLLLEHIEKVYPPPGGCGTNQGIAYKFYLVLIPLSQKPDGYRILIKALSDNEKPHARDYAAEAIAKSGNKSAPNDLHKALISNSDKGAKKSITRALVELKDKRAIDYVIELFSKSSERQERLYAIPILAKEASDKSIDAIGHVLLNSTYTYPFIKSADALVASKNKRIIKPIVKFLKMEINIKHPNGLPNAYRSLYVNSLLMFSEKDLSDALSQEAGESNDIAILLMAWIEGGEYLKKLDDIKPKCSTYLWLQGYAKLRWGDLTGLDLTEYLLVTDIGLKDFHSKIVAILPNEFPKDKSQIIPWLKENKSRLMWDKEKKRYYLKP